MIKKPTSYARYCLMHSKQAALLHFLYSVSLLALIIFGVTILNPKADAFTYAQDEDSAEVMPLAETIIPTASLAVASANLYSAVNPGDIAYLTSNVTYSANNIDSYTLQASYANGYNSLKLEGGTATLTGANGKTPANMADNTWGFGWGATSVSNESLTYYTMPNYGTVGSDLSTGRLETANPSNHTLASTTKRMVFAAKFGADNKDSGHYKTAVLLSLTASPKTVTYTVTFNNNGGSGTVSGLNTTVSQSSYDYAIPATQPTRSGYVFLGWNTSSSATSADTNYAPGKSIALNESSPSLTLYAIWGTNYRVSFNANGGANPPSGLDQTVVASSYSYTIPTTKPTRDGYTFLGWNTSSTATSANTSYDPGKSITLNQSSPSLTLYAVWKTNNPLAIITYMQSMTNTICTSAPIGTSTTLLDSRDNNSYQITRLDDGKCWMTTNLKLDLSKASLTSVNSNVTSTSPIKWNNEDKITLPSSSSGFEKNYASSVAKWSNGTGFSNSNQWKSDYGYYYNWLALTAYTGQVNSSICPKNWRLPSKDEYETLLSSAGIGDNSAGYTKIRNTPYSFVDAGSATQSSLTGLNSSGSYWAGTLGESYDRAYMLTFYSGSVGMYTTYRYYALPVRCIAQ